MGWKSKYQTKSWNGIMKSTHSYNNPRIQTKIKIKRGHAIEGNENKSMCGAFEGNVLGQ